MFHVHGWWRVLTRAVSSLFTFNPSPSPPASPWNSALASPDPGASSSNTRTATPLPGLTSIESEPQVGPVEYKLSLVSPTPARLQHLTTQLLWRLQQSCPSHNTAALVPP